MLFHQKHFLMQWSVAASPLLYNAHETKQQNTKKKKNPVSANIYRSALAPPTLLTILHKLHLCKSNRVQNPALITSKKPLTSLLPSRAISANACSTSTQHASWKSTIGLCTQNWSSICWMLFFPTGGKKKQRERERDSRKWDKSIYSSNNGLR